MTFEEALDIVGPPNADLLGKVVTIAGNDWTIDGSPEWSANYVYLTRQSEGEENADRKDMIIRPTGVIRQQLQLKGSPCS